MRALLLLRGLAERRCAADRLRVLATHLAPAPLTSPLAGRADDVDRADAAGRAGASSSRRYLVTAGAAALAASAAASSFAAAGAEGSSGAAHCEAAPKAALNPQQFVAFRLQQVQDISHNTKIFRFALDPDTRLGLTVASCLVTRAPIGPPGDDGKPKAVIRPYTPITPPDVTGHFDLLVKVYPNGKMSQHMFSLKPGDVLEMKGPIPKLPYQPYMKRSIGMVAGGTGITPMLQVIDAILSNPNDHTQVALVFANTSPADILLADQLRALAASHPNFKVYLMVDRAEAGAAWKGGEGFITADVLRKALPPPSPDSLVLVCGPPGMMRHVSGDKAPDKSQGEVSGRGR
ncbi:unnamed protein product [Closterium sp. Naga37s-1]|nr:unnamed protein product [Closterium sp. Naga37s-1]